MATWPRWCNWCVFDGGDGVDRLRPPLEDWPDVSSFHQSVQCLFRHAAGCADMFPDQVSYLRIYELSERRSGDLLHWCEDAGF